MTEEGADSFPQQLRKFQCFLIEHWEDFTAYNASKTYRNFLKLLSTDPHMTSVRIMNNLTGTQTIQALNELDPQYLGILVPELRLYRADIVSGAWVNTEFRFPNFTDPEIRDILASSNLRFPGAGITSFEISNEGNTEVTAQVALRANLNLHLTSINELETPRGTVGDPTPDTAETGTRTLRIIDLCQRPRGANESDFRIKAVVGWTMPSVSPGIPEENLRQLRDYINRTRRTYTLAPTQHKLDLREDGSIELSCDFIASIDAARRGDNPAPVSAAAAEFPLMGVLQGALDEGDLRQYLSERIRIIRRQEYLSCEERNAQAATRRGEDAEPEPTAPDDDDAEARSDERQTLSQRSARNKGILYNNFLEALLKKAAVHYIDLTGTELGLPSAISAAVVSSRSRQESIQQQFLTQEEARITNEADLTEAQRAAQIAALRAMANGTSSQEASQERASNSRHGIDSAPNLLREYPPFIQFLEERSTTRAQEAGAAQAQQRRSSVAAVVPQEGETTAQALEAATPTITNLNSRIKTLTTSDATAEAESRLSTGTTAPEDGSLNATPQDEAIFGTDLQNNREVADANLQSLNTIDPRQGDHYRVHFIYLGDLINLGLEYFRHRSIPFEMKQLMPIVAPTQIFPLDSSSPLQQVSLADIPISLEQLQTWFLNKIVATGIETITFQRYMSLISSNLLRQASGQNCADSASTPTTRTLTLSVDTIDSPHPTLYTRDLSSDEGINSSRVYEYVSTTPAMTAQQALNAKKYLFIHSPQPSFPELSFFRPTAEYDTRLARDAAFNILHLSHGAAKGIVKSVKYTKRETDNLAQSNILTALQQTNGTHGAFDPHPYNASVRLYGNSYFTPGKMVKLNPSFFGTGVTDLMRNISGYYSVQGVKSTIKPGEFETELDLVWQTPEVSRRQDAPGLESGQENNEIEEDCGTAGAQTLRRQDALDDALRRRDLSPQERLQEDRRRRDDDISSAEWGG